jgi:hypothetical protein
MSLPAGSRPAMFSSTAKRKLLKEAVMKLLDTNRACVLDSQKLQVRINVFALRPNSGCLGQS